VRLLEWRRKNFLGGLAESGAHEPRALEAGSSHARCIGKRTALKDAIPIRAKQSVAFEWKPNSRVTKQSTRCSLLNSKKADTPFFFLLRSHERPNHRVLEYQALRKHSPVAPATLTRGLSLQWAIFDAYMEDQERQRLNKELRKVRFRPFNPPLYWTQACGLWRALDWSPNRYSFPQTRGMHQAKAQTGRKVRHILALPVTRVFWVPVGRTVSNDTRRWIRKRALSLRLKSKTSHRLPPYKIGASSSDALQRNNSTI
jgi:hypothetical protein